MEMKDVRNEGHWLEGWLSDNAARVLIAVLIVAVSVVLLAGTAYFSFFLGPPLNIDPATLGQAGDYFGGLLNPVLSFLSVFALLVTIVIQSRELRLSREALKVSHEELKLSREEQAKSALALVAQNSAIQQQSFEQTFFAWLASYGDCLDTIEIVIDHDTGAQRRGRRVLHSWWEKRLSSDPALHRMREHIPLSEWESMYNLSRDGKSHPLRHISTEYKADVVEWVMSSWEYLYKEWEFALDSLFRDLYRLILWVDSQQHSRVTPAQKWMYISIIRAKLSWIELTFLFFNGLTPRGAAFKHLAEKYALFDNLTFDSDCALGYVREAHPAGIGYSDSAYSSVVARRAMGLPESAQAVLALASSGQPTTPP